jgi:parvulin-like peptidyl-prolyl isomerase
LIVKQKLIFIIFIVSSLLSCTDKRIDDPKILAVIEDQSINQNDFTTRFLDVRRRTGIPDNGETRRQILNSYVSEKILIQEARNRGLDKTEEGRFEHERIKVQELLNSYNQKFIKSNITVTDAELKNLYVKLNTKISARHLYASNKTSGDSLYNLLMNGASFYKLAQEVFEDPVLKESGGSLGYFSVDEMDPAFEDAAFKLKIGEISKPVRTSDGYSIIKVDDRWTKPLITENEYLKHRPKLKTYWLNRKNHKATQDHVDSLRQSLHIVFNEQLLKNLFELQKQNKNRNNIENSNALFANYTGSADDELLRSDFGTWSLADFREKARYISNLQKGWIRSEENLKDFVGGVVIRSYILEKAKKANLDKTEEYLANVRNKFDDYLFDKIRENVMVHMPVPEDSLKQMYNSNPDAYSLPAKINLQEIVVNTRESANFISQKLRAGNEFSNLARKYSVRRRSGVNGGDLGYVTAEDLGSWSPQAFSLKLNDWAGPYKADSMFVFIKCIDKIPPVPRTLDEAKEDLASTYRSLHLRSELERIADEVKKNSDVRVFTNKLKTLQINSHI